MRARVIPLLGLAFGAAVACGGGSSGGGAQVEALWVAPASLDALTEEHFFDHPWPSDLRRDPGGAIRVTGFYNPRELGLIREYLTAATGLLDGFSPVGSAYLRFTGPLDPASLPSDPAATLDPKSPVQIIDVDPASPEHGKRRAARLFWQRDEGVYWLADTLAVAPVLGYPLRPKTRYAIVVTRAVRAEGGGPVAPSADLEEVLGTRPATPRTDAARAAYAAAVADLAADGVAAADVAQLAVFTTNDPTSELFAVADHARKVFPPPQAAAAAWTAKDHTADYDVYEGSYGPSPNYQQGKIPFAKFGDGGNFVLDAQGVPVVQGQFDLRFSLVVPDATKCPPPPAGYPITLYAHGTGGDYRSLVDERGSVGSALAGKCIASMGIDQIFHGTRPGAPALNDPNRESEIELLFFNLDNPIAARTNGRQAAIDVVQQARLFGDSHVTVPAGVSRTGAAIAFDASKLLFVGHSQGGLNGPLFLAATNQARGGVLSGTGAMITIALLEKTEPQPSVAGAVRAVLGLVRPEEAAELNSFHPILNLAQMLVDAIDPVHYMPYIVEAPRAGLAPKSIYQTEGIASDGTGDNFAPPHGIEVASVAMGLPRMLPGVRPIPEDAFGGITDVAVPADGLSGNLAGGAASGVIAQWPPAAGSDGHFVLFDVPAARAQAAGFCRNLADDPHGRVPAP